MIELTQICNQKYLIVQSIINELRLRPKGMIHIKCMTQDENGPPTLVVELMHELMGHEKAADVSRNVGRST